MPGTVEITPQMCLACKGAKNLCGAPCILLARIDHRLPRFKVTSQDVFGTSPPSVFVGRFGYPDVSFGPLLPPLQLPEDQAARLDDASAWARSTIQEVLGMRSSLLRTKKTISVREARRPPPLLRVTQELTLSHRPVETEVHLVKRPNLELTARVGDVEAPMGPSVEADRARLTSNPRVLPAVERLHADEDARAQEAILELYRSGVPLNSIERLLSIGLLGQRRERKLVPTRWSITATDDSVGRQLLEGVVDYPGIDRAEYYQGTTHGNRFHVLLLPQGWAYDMMEVWIKGSMWALETSPFVEDWEDWRGRTRYASHIAGAYYAARLAVLEFLHGLRRQAGVFVYREITPDYWAPLGVWVIREGVRHALRSEPVRFDTLVDAVAYMELRTLQKGWARHSHLLGELRHQRRLHEYLDPT